MLLYDITNVTIPSTESGKRVDLPCVPQQPQLFNIARFYKGLMDIT